jgi:hypothetical protein
MSEFMEGIGDVPFYFYFNMHSTIIFIISTILSIQ